MARGESAVCLGCSKKFKQSEYSLQCTICGLWIHKACSGITDELYNLIDLQLQQTGRTYWACRPCTVYSQGLTHRMKEIENQLTEVKATCSRNEDGLQKVQAEVSKLAERVSKQEKKVEEVASVSGCLRQKWHNPLLWITDSLPSGLILSNIRHTSGMW